MSGHSFVFRSIFRNVSVLALGRIASALCSFVYIAFSVRALGLTDFGLLILIHSLSMTGSTLSRMQSWQTLIRFGSEAYRKDDHTRLKDVTGFCIRLDTYSGLAALVFSLIAVQIYAASAGWSARTQTLADLYACVAPFMYTGWCNGVLRMAGKFHLVPINDGSTAVVRTIGVLIGYVFQLHLAYFLAVWATTVLLDYGLFVFFGLRTLKRKCHFSYFESFRHWRWADAGMWRFTWGVSANQTLGSVSNHVATLLVGKGLGPAEVAVFRVCRQIASGIVTPAQLISPVLYPELVKMRDQKDWRGLKRVTGRVFAILLAISAVLLLTAAVAGRKLFRLMLHIHVPHTSFYIAILLLAAVMSLLIVPLEPLLIVVGQLKLLVRARTIITLLYFPALYFAGIDYGLTGACIATAASSLAVFLTCGIGVWRFTRRSRTFEK